MDSALIPSLMHLYRDPERGWVAICDTCEGGWRGATGEEALARLLLAVVPRLAERVSESGSPPSSMPAVSWEEHYVKPADVPRDEYFAVREFK